MSTRDHHGESGGVFHPPGPRPSRPWPVRLGFYLFLVIAAFYLITEHRAHLVTGLSWLPFVLLAACPLMHLLGHGGHGGHAGGRHEMDDTHSPNIRPPGSDAP